MPIRIPNLDDRNWRELRDEALRRIPVHNPEWTHLSPSDPGVTIIELFAFLTESLLYRSNLITERHRRQFLSLLGIPLHPGSAAQGLVTISNARGSAETLTLNRDLPVQAGSVPFYTTMGLDVLPIEAQIYTKREVRNPPPAVVTYYRRLYASYADAGLEAITDEMPTIYETTLFSPENTTPLTTAGTTDGSIWVALLARPSDADHMASIRQRIAGKTLNLGIVPVPQIRGRHIVPGTTQAANATPLRYEIPLIPSGGALPSFASGERFPRYDVLPAVSETDVRETPGIVQLRLPDDPNQLRLWTNLDPLEAGVGDFPPALENDALAARVLTWIRIRAATGAALQCFWMGINTVPVVQRRQVRNELLAAGTGEPDQVRFLSQVPVIPGSLSLTVRLQDGTEQRWEPIDDLLRAGSEIPTKSPLDPPGTPLPQDKRSHVFIVDYEAGRLQFGDGHFGTRLPFGATARANYDVSVGREGNVPATAINTSTALPPGLRVQNPVATWGASDPETVQDGEKHITSFLQQRERCTDLRSFHMLTYRVAGVGRVEVLPAFTPVLPNNEPGDAPGAVTVMVLPVQSSQANQAPMPSQELLNAVCDYLAPRRLVTTELFVRPPTYYDIWVSVGIQVAGGYSIGTVTRDVRLAIEAFLSPLPASGKVEIHEQNALFAPAQLSHAQGGYPLYKSVVALELQAVASRVEGVQYINELVLYDSDDEPQDTISMRGLMLPRLAGIAVETGDAPDVNAIPGINPPQTTLQPPDSPFAPVPADPENC